MIVSPLTEPDTPPSQYSVASPHSGQHQRFDDMTLEQQEDDQHRYYGHRRRGHDQVVAGRMGAVEEGQGQGQRALVEIVDGHQGPQVVVPRGQEGEDAEGGESGPQQGKDDAAEDGPFAGSVQSGRLDQVTRNPGGKLANQKDTEGADHSR